MISFRHHDSDEDGSDNVITPLHVQHRHTCPFRLHFFAVIARRRRTIIVILNFAFYREPRRTFCFWTCIVFLSLPRRRFCLVTRQKRLRERLRNSPPGYKLHLNWISQFKVDRLQIIVVAKKYIYVPQLFISRMPKMRALPQLVSAPLNPIPIAEHFRRSHPPCEHSRGQHV